MLVFTELVLLTETNLGGFGHPFLFGFPQMVVREQRNKDSAAQRPIPDNDSLQIFRNFDTRFGISIFKVRLISHAPTVRMFKLATINHEPVLRVDY